MASTETSSSPCSTQIIIYSTVRLSVPNSGLAFKKWSYVTIVVIFDPTILLFNDNSNGLVYLDTNYIVILIDNIWFTKKLSPQKINIMLVPLNIKRTGVSRHKSGEFSLTTFYIPSFDQESWNIYIYIRWELDLVEGFKINILINNNVLYIESFSINSASSSVYILSYIVNIIINAKYYSEFLKYKILANITTFIFPRSKTLILFQ